jgi:hypothetical protein
MRFEMIHGLGAAFLAAAASVCAAPFAAAEAAPPAEPGQPAFCAIRCIAPPEGCRYVGMVTTGPCNAVTCGRLICDEEEICTLPCAPPPDGCYYANAMPSGPCDEVTCGQLVCGDGTL